MSQHVIITEFNGPAIIEIIENTGTWTNQYFGIDAPHGPFHIECANAKMDVSKNSGPVRIDCSLTTDASAVKFKVTANDPRQVEFSCNGAKATPDGSGIASLPII